MDLDAAISVLLQAVDAGKANGAYNWEDLEIIGEARKFILSLAKPPAESEDEPQPEVEVETKEVILEPTKD